MKNCNISPLTILNFFLKKGYRNNGLTLPYLFGAYIYLNPNCKLKSFKEFLKIIDNEGVTLMKCEMVDEFILGPLDIESKKYIEIGYYREISNFIITDNSLEEINSYFDLENYLDDLYKSEIANKTYSKEKNEWIKFSKDDFTKLDELKFGFNN